MSNKLNKDAKILLWLASIKVVFDFFIKLPLWLGIVAYLLWITNAGFMGWLLFFIYVPMQLIGFAISQMLEKASKNVTAQKESDKLGEAQFMEARPVNPTFYKR